MSFVSSAGARIPHAKFTPVPTPVLLLHFDGDVVDAIGNTTFALGYNTGLEVSDTPTYEASEAGFGQRAVTVGNCGAPGTSGVNLSVLGRQFTFEGRSYIPTGQNGGIVLGKNFYAAEPGTANNDFGVTVAADALKFSWGAQTVTAIISPAINDQLFHWAITDDGALLRLYLNGVLIGSHVSVNLDATPPTDSAATVSLFNSLQGYLGATPNWGSTRYLGRIDELVMWLDYAKYTGATYTVPTAPYAF